MRRIERLAADDGSVLLWVIGCLLVALLSFETAAATATLVADQRELQNAAEVSALAAANELELSAFQDTGDYADVGVDLLAARAVVNAQLVELQCHCAIGELTQTANGVRLRLARQWAAPFGLAAARLTATAEVSLVLGG